MRRRDDRKKAYRVPLETNGIVTSNRPRTEAKDIWFAIAILLVLSAYRLVSGLLSHVEAFFLAYTEFPIAEVLTNSLFFWLLALLWVAYRRWQAAVAAKQELERVIGSISPDVLIVVDQNRTITMCSGASHTMFGREKSDLLGRRTEELYYDRRVAGHKGELYRLLEQIGFHTGTATGRHRDGHTFPLELITGRIREHGGVVILMRDITDRQRAEDALRESEERFAQFMRYLPACAAIKDFGGRIVYLNDYFEKAFGWRLEDCIGKTVFDLFPRACAEASQRDDQLTLQRNEVQRTVEQTPQRGDVRTMLTYRFPIIRADGPPLLGAISLDITERQRADEERRKLELQIQQTQKLESLGLLGGGIAHDFNNLLMGIMGNADLALADVPFDSPARDCIEKVLAATRRASDLANQLLAYSGEGKLVPIPLNVSNLVRDMRELLTVSVSKKADLVLDLADGLPAVECDVTQMRQVIMNLVINASEALNERSGRILIETGVRYCDRIDLGKVYLPEGLPEGDYVYVRVSDTGCGMDDATLARMFDPFFTTKFAGRGLGLAAVLGIVRGHRGAVQVNSAPDVGTAFTVLLPTTAKAAHPIEPPAAETDTWTGTGKVLVVDDEDAVRDVARRMLESIGFTTIAASDGRAAVTLVREHADTIDAILLDMTMPVLDGTDAVVQIRTTHPDLPIVLSSGYDRAEELARTEPAGTLHFLQKPYRLETMRACFKQIFGE